jgi:hypothetical protein
MTMRYIVTLKPKLGVDPNEVKAVINDADDWYRFGPFTWVIVSDDSAREWSARLRQFVQPDGNLLILGLDPSERAGWMPRKFWRWMNDYDDTE